MLNPKFILKEEILSFLSESKQFNKSRIFLLENSESFSDDAFNDNFKKLFLEAIDHKSFYNNPNVEDNLRQVAIEFQKIAPELSKKYQQFVNNSIKDPLNHSKKTIWDYKNFIDSWQDSEAFGKALHVAARKINPDSFRQNPVEKTPEQSEQKNDKPPVTQTPVELNDDEKIINKFLKAVGMKDFIQKWIEKNDEALSEPDKEKILQYCEEELFPDRFLSESKVIKISKERLAQIIKKELK